MIIYFEYLSMCISQYFWKTDHEGFLRLLYKTIQETEKM